MASPPFVCANDSGAMNRAPTVDEWWYVGAQFVAPDNVGDAVINGIENRL
jgi:hypothetical protein